MIRHLYFLIKSFDSFFKIKGFHFFQYRILPLVSFLLVFTFVISSYNFLDTFSNSNGMNSIAVFAGVLYLIYIVYSLYKTVYNTYNLLTFSESKVKISYWINITLGLSFQALFVYFFIQLYPTF